MSSEIVGIGANVYDTLILLSQFPTEDKKTFVDELVHRGGGPCVTGLVAATRLGARTAWLGMLADDPGGKFLFNDLEKYGVNHELVAIEHGKTSFSSTVLLNKGNGSRTCLLDRGTLSPLVLSEAHRREIANASILMIDGNENEAVLDAVQYARASNTAVLYDAGSICPNIETLLSHTDYLIPSAEFALSFTGETDLEKAAIALYRKYGSKWVVITNGCQGGVFYDGKNRGTYPAFSVSVVDSNGAGDVFHGAFAYGVLHHWALPTVCQWSSAVSALKCQSLGAREGVPSYDDTIQFLKEQGYYVT